MEQVFPGVFRSQGHLFTKSRFLGFRVHGERRVMHKGNEYREWSPYHSKLAAAIAKGLKTFPFKKGQNVLYLGAAQGVTSSFLSDIIGPEGNLYCVEFAPRAMRDLIFVCEKRDNMHPILEDAMRVEKYAEDVGPVDVLFQDVAAKEQAEILLRNATLLKEGGFAALAVKSQSIDSAVDPAVVYRKTLDQLSSLKLIEKFRLDPFEKDHLFCLFQKG